MLIQDSVQNRNASIEEQMIFLNCYSIAYGLHKDDNDELIADAQLERAAALQAPALWSQAIARCPVWVLPALGMRSANAEVSAAY